MAHSTYTLLLLAGLFSGCSDDVSPEQPVTDTKHHLISADSINSISVNELKHVASISGQNSILSLVKHGVTTYRINYQTTYNGKPIEASGLLYIPQNLTSPAPLISLQHGTTFVKDDAPSVSNSFTGMEYFGAAGYIAAMPDFIGYGSSAQIFHPYYDREHSALAVIDMIRSAREFLSSKNVQTNEQLFLAGYSEGGYVTLAATKQIEEQLKEFQIAGVAAGAGGYDLMHMLESVTGSNYYSYPAYLAFVLISYNNTYQWNKPLNYFFQDRYADALSKYMNGEYSGWQINRHLTTDTRLLLNPDFLARLKNPDGEPELKAALQANSVAGWNSTLSIRLFHGTRDEIIPYENSEQTLLKFKEAGAKDVDLLLIQNGTHGNSLIPMLQQVVPWFEQLRK
jgi:alpha-beta hydrolase superfamily lysophospholipase